MEWVEWVGWVDGSVKAEPTIYLSVAAGLGGCGVVEWSGVEWSGWGGVGGWVGGRAVAGGSGVSAVDGGLGDGVGISKFSPPRGGVFGRGRGVDAGKEDDRAHQIAQPAHATACKAVVRMAGLGWYHCAYCSAGPRV